MQKIIRLVCVSDRGQRVGEDGSSAKLTNEDARMIRILRFEHGVSARQLAEKFEVSRNCIRQIIDGRTYPEIYKVIRKEVEP